MRTVVSGVATGLEYLLEQGREVGRLEVERTLGECVVYLAGDAVALVGDHEVLPKPTKPGRVS